MPNLTNINNNLPNDKIIHGVSEDNFNNLESSHITKTSVQAEFKNVLNMQREMLNSVQPKVLTESCNFSPTTAIPIDEKQVSTENSTVLIKSLSRCNKSRFLVRINRIKAEDVRLMQQSIKEFIKKSPKLTKKMCLLKSDTTELVKSEPNDVLTEQIQQHLQSEKEIEKANVPEDKKSAILDDTFNIMKAHEKMAQKRKHPASVDDVPPEEICEYSNKIT